MRARLSLRQSEMSQNVFHSFSLMFVKEFLSLKHYLNKSI